MLLISLAFAVEGMWLPGQLGLQEPAMKKAGLQVPITEISDPKGALLGSIVHVGGYCSGSFVSQDGLILTNHHCAWEFLQANTMAENNRLQDGYIAKSRAEELSGGPDGRLYIMEKDEDVTSVILKSVKSKMSDVARQGAIDEATAKLLDSCEKGRDDIECEVTAEHGGLSYRLLTHRVLRDVRVVYAPPMTVGSFGGDLDNFEWPRHDGDFAILRAYVGVDGSAKDYATTNVPYKPTHFLKVQPQGISPGEFVMVAGFPGSTERYELLSEVSFLAQTYYPQVLQQLKAMEAIVAEERKRPEGEEKLGAVAQELANYRKYVQGILDNVNGSDVLDRKAAFEKGLRDWVNGDAARKAKYGAAIAELDKQIAEDQAWWRYDWVLWQGLGQSDLFGVARRAVHWVYEREKPDTKRDDGYRDRDREQIEARFHALDRSLYVPADRRVFKLALEESQKLSAHQRLAPVDALVAGGMDGALDRLYGSSLLMSAESRVKLLDMSKKDLEKSTDPWIQLAVAMEPILNAARDRNDAFEGAMARLRPLWMGALLEWKPGVLYPDANNTLRITYGNVMGYSPRDAVSYLPQTTVQGLVAKAGSGLYEVPPADFMAYAEKSAQSPWVDAKLGDVPMCFLSDLDSTGGNSGSATLNAKGELVGLLFDGNYESMAADWLFDQGTTRSIHVDIRYLLFVLDGYGDGAWIRQELIGR